MSERPHIARVPSVDAEPYVATGLVALSPPKYSARVALRLPVDALPDAPGWGVEVVAYGGSAAEAEALAVERWNAMFPDPLAAARALPQLVQAIRTLADVVDLERCELWPHRKNGDWVAACKAIAAALASAGVASE